MRCPVCGHDMDSKAKRCPTCKSRPAVAAKSLAMAHTPPAKKQSPSFFHWMTIGAGALLMLLVVLAISRLLPGVSGSTDPSGSVLASSPAYTSVSDFIRHERHYIFSPNNINLLIGEKNLTFYSHTDSIPTDIYVGSIQEIKYSLDGNALAFLTGRSSLYMLYRDRVLFVASGVSSFRLSADGQGLAYEIIDGIMGYNVHNLYYYDPQKEESIQVDRSGPAFRNYVISPDGKNIVYVKSGAESELLHFDGTESTVLVESGDGSAWSGGYVLATSNYGWHIYTYDNDTHELQHFCFGEINTIPVDNPSFYFNSDHSQVLYHRMDGTYIATGADPAFVSNDRLSYILPHYCYSLEESHVQTYTKISCTTVPTKNLYNHVYTGFLNKIVYVQQVQNIPILDADQSASIHVKITYDDAGEYLYYIFNNALFSVHLDPSAPDAFLPKQIEEGCRDFAISKNGQRLYYLKDIRLMHMDLSEKAPVGQPIAENVSASAFQAFALHPRGYYYYVSNGTLYGGVFGNAPRQLRDNVSGIYQEIDGSVYVCCQLSNQILVADEFGTLYDTEMSWGNIVYDYV